MESREPDQSVSHDPVIGQSTIAPYFSRHFEKFVTSHYRLIVAALLLVNLSLAIASVVDKSLTYDESFYIGVGNYLLRTGDTSAIVLGTPPLPLFLNSIFWQFIEFDPFLWENFVDIRNAGYRSIPLIFESGHDPDLLIFLARLPVILTFPLLAIIIFSWSRELFGIKAGLLALTWAVFSPNLLAHARLATTDFLAVLTIFVGLYCFRACLKNPSWIRMGTAGILLGLALLSKFTALMLLPVYLLVTLLLPRTDLETERVITQPIRYIRTSRFLAKSRGTPHTIYVLVIISAIALLVIWAGYFFEFRSLYAPVYLDSPPEEFFTGLFKFCYEEKIRIPAVSYFISYDWQNQHMQSGHPSFLMGQTSWRGWWYYFPVAFLIKTPIPTLILLCICAISFLKQANRKRGEEAFLLMPVAFIFAGGLFSNINLGLRLILPIYPFLFVWISRVVTLNRSKWYSAFLTLSTAWYIGANIYIYPHYLEYFNELIGGPRNGYKYLVDSNLDWGQDLKYMIRYIKENNIKPSRIVCFGAPLVLEYYGYQNEVRDVSEIKDGYLVISATYLYGLYLSPEFGHGLFLTPNCYDWLKKYQPVERICHSIFIYKIPP